MAISNLKAFQFAGTNTAVQFLKQSKTVTATIFAQTSGVFFSKILSTGDEFYV